MKVSLSIQRNPKHETSISDRLMECITEAQAGVWEGCLQLDPRIREWVKSIHIELHVDNSGKVPIQAMLTIELESGGEQPSTSWTSAITKVMYKFGREDSIRHGFLNTSRTSIFSLIENRNRRLLSLAGQCTTLCNTGTPSKV